MLVCGIGRELFGFCQRSISDCRGNAIGKPFAQLFRGTPSDVIVLTRVKMDVADRVPSTGKDNRNIESMCKTGFIIDAAARAGSPLREISD